MENPYTTHKDYAYVSEDRDYSTKDQWQDVDGLSIDVEGYYLIICTLCINTGLNANVGFCLVDGSNRPLIPFRTSVNTRIPVHFSYEPCPFSGEDQTPVSFHMVAYCKGPVKLRLMTSDVQYVSDGPALHGRAGLNAVGSKNLDKPWNHKSICTMSAIPLCSIEEQKNNTTGPQPIGRRAFIPRVEEDIKKPVPKNPDKKPPTGGGGTSKL